jgi:glyoxylase-like metal-dependent hydrolase (beta-lactamase superfamily II)
VSYTLGDIELISLSDGGFALDGGAMFGVVPKPLWSRRTTPDDRNRIPLGLRPLLLTIGGKRVLIDGGVGDKLKEKDREIYAIDRRGSLIPSLAAHGLAPADIDVAIATHLHFDHVGGFTTIVDGRAVPTFPNARYVIRKGEWDDATHPHERNHASYMADDFMPLVDAKVADFMDADGEVLPGVRVRRTGGHTRHHEIVLIESGGRTAVFTADLIPTSAHVDAAWIMAYDLYPMDTLAAKKAFLAEAIAGEYVIFFEHDPHMAAGIIRQDGRRLTVEPVDVAPTHS